ncbi:hypothetical protein [Methylocella sp. CPCC 101449]|jgi:hypothetical protein|uniref:hypothetical protein n=1 Tax=Methylocella sp. CPCC 101449 TaxID=2987531 RepID=UPI002891FFD5|nr:hypothetical protein [Methylocella sp. CPCC 101449]MDT2021493.1 hypothetical protein [Methylocella sp. CPCC 101449]HEV2571585.1 hypothetical protein [Beijerinckiaceae bacterium]
MQNTAKLESQDEVVAEAGKIATAKAKPGMSHDDKDELLENAMMGVLDRNVAIPWFGNVEEFAKGGPPPAGGKFLMHYEPRLPQMPEKPTLMDYLKKRLLLSKRGGNHLLQSANLAKKNGLPDKLVLACLLHDIAVVAHIRTDHGYYGAQMIEPYVDEETSWSIRYHQALRFFPDPSVGYEYPELYTRVFGEDYVPPNYVKQAYEEARNHKWYMSARLVTMNDLYSFDPNVKVDVDDFTDIIGRTFRQPEDGLGFDNSPSSHMWRSLIWPNNFL